MQAHAIYNSTFGTSWRLETIFGEACSLDETMNATKRMLNTTTNVATSQNFQFLNPESFLNDVEVIRGEGRRVRRLAKEVGTAG